MDFLNVLHVMFVEIQGTPPKNISFEENLKRYFTLNYSRRGQACSLLIYFSRR